MQGASHHQPQEQQWGHQRPHCSQDVVALGSGAVLPRSLQIPSYLLVSGLQGSARVKMLTCLWYLVNPQNTQSNSRIQTEPQILMERYGLRHSSGLGPLPQSPTWHRLALGRVLSHDDPSLNKDYIDTDVCRYRFSGHSGSVAASESLLWERSPLGNQELSPTQKVQYYSSSMGNL